MNITRTLFAALSVLALAGIASNASALSKNFLPSGKDENAKYGKVLDECKGVICVKVRGDYGYVRIKLEDTSPNAVKFFLVSFQDDVTGKLVTRKVFSKDGTVGILNGLTASAGNLHTFSVRACYDNGCGKAKPKFSFTA
jgi:hypothetical protein